MVLDKEKPYIGCMRGLNLAAVRPTSVQLTSTVSEWLNMLRHNLQHEPALTETLCMYCINVTQNSAVTKGAQCP
jgi:hypothetical protein